MSLFFFLSGYVALMTRERSFSKGIFPYLFRKAETLLVPFLVWSLLVNRFIDILPPPATYNVIELFQRPDLGVWFLFSLFLIQVACIPLLRWQKWYVIIPNIAALAACGYFLESFAYLNYMHWIPFVTGMAIAKFEKQILTPTPATIALLIFIVFEVVHPHPVATSISLGIALLYVCTQIKTDNIISRQTLSIGQNTMGIYLIHFFFVWAKGYRVIDMSGLHATLTLSIMMVISFFISMASVYLSKILQFFPIVGYLLLGKRIK
jgi:surface polysaccharide O-acyltransferase-like enzyme